MSPQVVLITGALTGIGRATAVAFARKGAKVVVSGRHDDKGQALVTELQALGAEAEFVRADVQKEDDVRTLVDKAVERFGRSRRRRWVDGQLQRKWRTPSCSFRCPKPHALPAPCLK
jgi:NAD(P)-dependent dehydrogenase (short-subunit alcohol dehydrogenase family)